MTPTFSRVEIRHGNAADILNAATDLRKLADDLSRAASEIQNEEILRLAAHAAIRKTSKALRGAGK